MSTTSRGRGRRTQRKPGNLTRKFADRLGDLRRRKSYTILRFGQQFGAKEQTVRDWLNGRVLPRVEALYAISTHFGVSIDWLLGFDVPEDRTQRETIGDLRQSLRRHLVDLVSERVNLGVTANWSTPESLVPEEGRLMREVEAAYLERAEKRVQEGVEGFARDLKQAGAQFAQRRAARRRGA